MDRTGVAIHIEDLNFSYPDGTAALRDVCLGVDAGQRLGLIGPNGAGKSTLLLHLNGLLRGEGKLSVLGLEVNRSNVDEIRRKVGLVFQNPEDQLFMPTVKDEVAYAAVNAGYSDEEVETRVEAALRTVGMSGYDGKHPSNLSVGQKKRVCIASVLVTDNELLVLDEPSSGLDPAGRRSLINLLSDFDCTMVIATHDLDLVGCLCDTVAVMTDGTMVRTGPTDAILHEESYLREVGL